MGMLGGSGVEEGILHGVKHILRRFGINKSGRLLVRPQRSNPVGIFLSLWRKWSQKHLSVSANAPTSFGTSRSTTRPGVEWFCSCSTVVVILLTCAGVSSSALGSSSSKSPRSSKPVDGAGWGAYRVVS